MVVSFGKSQNGRPSRDDSPGNLKHEKDGPIFLQYFLTIDPAGDNRGAHEYNKHAKNAKFESFREREVLGPLLGVIFFWCGC
jgi:hypothetical protein